MRRLALAIMACWPILLLSGCDAHTDLNQRESPKPATVPAGISVDNHRPFLLSDLSRTKAACIFFVGTDCPISNAYAPEIERIIGEYSAQGVSFYVIYAVRDLTPAMAADHAKSFGFRCPVILDPNLELAEALGATRMPEVVLLPPQGEAVYQGRIDDRYPAPGAKRREHPTTLDLRDALSAFVAGRPIARPRTPAVGCHLELPQR